MNKYAGVENSGVRDPKTGKPITITVSVRKAIRESDPRWSKVRNSLLNPVIANDFARGKAQIKFFKVKGSGLSGWGHVRDSGGGAYIAIVGANEVRIVSVSAKSGTPRLSASPPQQSGPPEVKASYNSFFIKHDLGDTFGDMNMAEIVEQLHKRTGLSPNTIIEHLKQHEHLPEIVDIVSNLDPVLPGNYRATVTDPHYEPTSGMPGSGFALQAPLFGP